MYFLTFIMYFMLYFNISDQGDVPESSKSAGKRSKNELNFQYACKELRRNLIIARNYQKTFISVRRWKIIEDSFEILAKYKHTPSKLKWSLKVDFIHEYSIDTGGLTKEWFEIFSSKVFHPDYKLFRYSDDKHDAVEINPMAEKYHKDFFDKFQILGLFVGMAIFHNQLLNVRFSVPFLKAVLGKPVDLNDVARTDFQYYKSLLKILENDPSGMKLTFAVEHPMHPDRRFYLKRLGHLIRVNQENKNEYVQRLIKWRFDELVENEMLLFMDGFSSIISVISPDLIKNFRDDELQLIISGERKIDIKFWKKYANFRYCAPQFIAWFWQAVEEFDNEKRSKLLQFVTGCPRIHVDGSNPFQFDIKCISTDLNRIPRGHTCGNWMEIPVYETYEKLVEKLSIVTEYSTGFTNI